MGRRVRARSRGLQSCRLRPMRERMGSLSARVREHFAKREDPYAGADLERIIRLGGVLWVVGVVVGAALLPLAPPTHAFEPKLGWALAGLMFAGGTAVAIRTFAVGTRMSTNEMLANAYTGLFSEAAFEWMAGG